MDSQTRGTALNRFGPAGYSALLVAAAVVSRFAVLSNDAFPLRWQAEYLSFSNPASFFNGFFPIGYPLALRLAAYTHVPFASMEVFQALLASLYVFLAVRLFKECLGTFGLLFALAVTLFYPSLIRAILSATPDFVAALAALLAFQAISNRSYVLAGFALGAGALFRTHMLAMVVATVVAIMLVGGDGRWRNVLRYGVGALPLVFLQAVIQVWSGHGPFESSQIVNVYRMMYGIDWSNPPRIPDTSILSIIVRDPLRFTSAYLANLWSSALGVIAILTVIGWQMRAKGRPTALLVLLTSSLIYLLIVTIGYSPRAVIPVWPIVVVAITLLLQRMSRHELLSGLQAAKRRLALGCLAAMVLVAIIEIFLSANHAGARVAEYREIEQELNLQSPKDAQRIYSDDFSLYFPSLQGRTPRTSGGWAEIGLPGYLRDCPHLSDSTSESFRQSLLQNGLEFAIFRVPPINERAYASVISDTAHFTIDFKTDHHAIYRVK